MDYLKGLQLNRQALAFLATQESPGSLRNARDRRADFLRP